MLKKTIASLAVVLVFGFYVAFQRGLFQSTSKVVVETPTPVTPTTPESTPAPVSTAQYRDGVYTGSVADAFYGPLQVKTTINGGKITDVQFLQYPNDRDTSREINGQAMPLLKSEAIKAQSANVDVISGATQTSRAFLETMGVALAQAK
jgi:uncharacterized protein with FMN-binding domain